MKYYWDTAGNIPVLCLFHLSSKLRLVDFVFKGGPAVDEDVGNPLAVLRPQRLVGIDIYLFDRDGGVDLVGN